MRAEPLAIATILVALTALCLLGGCGSSSASAAKTPASPARARVTMSTAPDPDVDLEIDDLATTPGSPTTARVITVHFVIANHGSDCTDYGQQPDGTLSYTPIGWFLYRDGQMVSSGYIFGLTGLDRVTRDIILKDQPPGDRHFELIVDPENRIPERLGHDIHSLLTLRYGGSG